MTTPPPQFNIDESRVDGSIRLSLSGELDLASAPLLEDRLARLRAGRKPVALDLSQLQFIDSTGLHLLIRELGEARAKGWELVIEPHVSPPVLRLFKIVRLDHLVAGADA